MARLRVQSGISSKNYEIKADNWAEVNAILSSLKKCEAEEAMERQRREEINDIDRRVLAWARKRIFESARPYGDMFEPETGRSYEEFKADYCWRIPEFFTRDGFFEYFADEAEKMWERECIKAESKEGGEDA